MVTRIVCAANRYNDVIILGARHFDSAMHRQIAQLDSGLKPDSSGKWEQGFIDQFGNFHDRLEAHIIATAANQIIRRVGGDDYRLYSENLY